MSLPVPDIITRLHEAWSALDPERITALFSENGVHISPYVNEYIGLNGAALKSRAAIRLYAEVVTARVSSLEIDPISVISDYDDKGGRAAVEYWRSVNGEKENRRRTVEIVEWVGDEITSCHVYYF